MAQCVFENKGKRDVSVPYFDGGYTISRETWMILRTYGTVLVPPGGSCWREGNTLQLRNGDEVLETVELPQMKCVYLAEDTPIADAFGEFRGYVD